MSENNYELQCLRVLIKNGAIGLELDNERVIAIESKDKLLDLVEMLLNAGMIAFGSDVVLAEVRARKVDTLTKIVLPDEAPLN